MTMHAYLAQGLVDDPNYNCCEKMVRAADVIYNLGLSENALRMPAGFGGGMHEGYVCGALTGAIMVLGMLFVKERAKEGTLSEELTKELFARYRQRMGHVDCEPLKAAYRTEAEQCRNVILAAAAVVDELVEEQSRIAKA